MNRMQELIDALSEGWRKERAETQMTIEDLLSRLDDMGPDVMLDGLGHPHSYRGYYSDLALEPLPGGVTVAKLAIEVNSVLGTELTGYKGGEFLMQKNTPVWVSHYGDCGKKLIAINDDGSLDLEEDEW